MESLMGEARLSLRRGNRNLFTSGLDVGADMNRQELVLGETSERSNWNQGHLGDEIEKQCNGNSMACARVTLSNALVMIHREPESPPSVIRHGVKWRDWDTIPVTKHFTYNLSCIQCVLEPEISRIVIKETKYISFRNLREHIQNPTAKHQVKVGEYCGKRGAKLGEPEWSGIPQKHGGLQNKLQGSLQRSGRIRH